MMTIRKAAIGRFAMHCTVGAMLAIPLMSGTHAKADEAGDLSWAALYARSNPATGTPREFIAPSASAVAAAPSDRSDVARRIAEVAARHGVPARFALAVARIESNMRCQARGSHGELGPLQIKPATARGLGYTGPAAALNSCGAGLEWGMRHLAIAYQRCGSAAGAAALHNRGLAASCSRTAYSNSVTRTMASL
ncbi:lytic transglycosylase domain-containing protein [Phreatobacter aquaticus]|uniref:Lytic transglycosylase domain-containing protein n=1 Tax=Phreatobacter aquaticus TaxID=2570229 RepID=A0A4D7QJC1_9HYPH|nr:transglycosylase SLT domain-containing protein [Phreatobacter aquaticus]QCK86741.1 lytic transglycosylase domain-containing protein [Phreatobacter aquaticus]